MAATPVQHRSEVNGVGLTWFEWGTARSDAPSYLLIHATGFHARCWDQVVAQLGDAHVVAVDMRGHGRSDATPPFTWDTFGDDLALLLDELPLQQAVGVGHSMGGHALVQAAAARPQAFARLLLVDPVIMAPELYASHGQWVEGEEHPTARRRNRWRDWQEMYDRFADRLPFSRWQPAVLEDYCRWGVLPAAERGEDGKDGENGGAFVLACPPRVEASIYLGSAARDIFAAVAAVQMPVTVLRARQRSGERDAMDFSASPTWPDLAARFAAGRDVPLYDHSHFIPMEDPALTAAFMLGER